MLGILIGIAAVILTVGFGEGASAQIRAQINSLGTNLLIITPGSATSSGGVNGPLGSATTLTVQDAGALASKAVAPDIAAVAPISTTRETLTAGTTNWTTSVVGTTPGWLHARARTVAEGRFLTAADERNVADVTVLGPTTANKLFGAGDPLGQTVNVNGVPLEVVGVLKSAGGRPAPPTRTTRRSSRCPPWTSRSAGRGPRWTRSTSRPPPRPPCPRPTRRRTRCCSTCTGSARPTRTSPSTPSSRCCPPPPRSNKTLTVLLAGIAAISLLVGGIGVMNIMLVSVTERIREIGLRKALGATPRVIRRQFLVEASLLGLAGGVLGAALGLVGAIVLPHLIPAPSRSRPPRWSARSSWPSSSAWSSASTRPAARRGWPRSTRCAPNERRTMRTGDEQPVPASTVLASTLVVVAGAGTAYAAMSGSGPYYRLAPVAPAR